MLRATSTRPRDSREVMRFLIAGSTADSSEPTRRCMSRKRLFTVLRSTETEKSSPATIPLPYPVIDFIVCLPTDYIESNLCHLRNLWKQFFLVCELKLVQLLIFSAL